MLSWRAPRCSPLNVRINARDISDRAAIITWLQQLEEGLAKRKT
ncbi:MAG TPA: hypothetical protein QGI62_01240 [Anaerolineales bacterium]|nr:hypothetical protein [Anaerolineales bacterium]